MRCSISIILLLGCAWPIAGHPLGALVQLRRNAYPIYASDASEEYEPYAVAALPLHTPVQILQVYSPPSRRHKLRKPAKRPAPESDLYAYDTSHIEQAYDQAYEPYAENVYADSETQPEYSRARDQYEDEASSVILYARPNKSGGFSYRKPAATAATAAPRLREAKPVIIRIHKYRVIH